VLGRGRGGDRYAGRLGREDETDRVAESCELSGVTLIAKWFWPTFREGNGPGVVADCRPWVRLIGLIMFGVLP
jgi:hypothetical protein